MGEHDSIPISLIEHYVYCPTQAWLIGANQQWEDSWHTVRGHAVHARVDAPGAGHRVEVSSDQLGIHGRADLVEQNGEYLYPVEYKSGRKIGGGAVLQVVAVAWCLEEMTGHPVRQAAIYSHGMRQRTEVVINETLREQLVSTISDLRITLAAEEPAREVFAPKCTNCSLRWLCLPGLPP